MVMFLFKAYDNKGHFDEWTLRESDMESGLDLLTDLTNVGWVLTDIKLLRPTEKGTITLPVGIIDGAYFSGPIQRLKLEWETVLVYW